MSDLDEVNVRVEGGKFPGLMRYLSGFEEVRVRVG